MVMAGNNTAGITYGTSTYGTSTTNTIYEPSITSAGTTTGTDYPLWQTTSTICISFNENNLVIETNDGKKSLDEYCHDKYIEFMNDQKEFCIKDINVYGSPEPRVVEVEFYHKHKPIKVKAICDKEDKFDLARGIYICIAKLLYKDSMTLEGIIKKADELSLYKHNEKIVNNAIKDYKKKIKTIEEAKEKEKQKKKEEASRREKKIARKKKQRERKNDELAKAIKKAIKE